MSTLPNALPIGRLSELLSRDDSNLIAYKNSRGLFGDCLIKRYASRKALETFLKNPGQWEALVKTEVDSNMLVHPAFQKEKGKR